MIWTRWGFNFPITSTVPLWGVLVFEELYIGAGGTHLSRGFYFMGNLT